jgi:hypothetical protein
MELTVGDAGQGVTYAEQALAAAAPLKSQRAKDDLIDVHRALADRAEVPGAAGLRARVNQALKAG